MSARSQFADAGIGHNSGHSEPMPEDDRLPPWATPSALSFEEMAALNTGSNRLTHQINVLSAAISDPRLGDVSIPRLLIVAVIKYLSRETGTAYPGLKRLAEDIYHELRKLPPKTAEQVLKNAVTLVRQCGYLLSKKAAPPGSIRAVANFAVGFPDPDTRRQAVSAFKEWQAKEAAKEGARRESRGARSSGNPPGYVRPEVTQPVTSAQVTQVGDLRGAEVTHTRGAEVTHTGPHSILLNLEESNLQKNGADALAGVGARIQRTGRGSPKDAPRNS